MGGEPERATSIDRDDLIDAVAKDESSVHDADASFTE
jgi:hypothetical protein